MTTRRGVLRLAAVGMVAGCTTTTRRPVLSGDRLVVELAGGLAVVDAISGRPVVPPARAVAGPDWSIMVQARTKDTTTELVTREVATGRVVSSTTLQGQLEPRAVSADGRLTALVTPAGNGRTSTTIVVADSSGERTRLDLAGNLVPEAFAVDGSLLIVLDNLPPAAPDRYRVRVVELAMGRVLPLNTRVKTAVPNGAEEEMRGEGRQAVYAPGERMLFTLYTHQPDHLHTRDLLASARADKPHVHAFVHSLSLAEAWAYCIDLPAPFGEHDPAGHAIAFSQQAETLVVVDAPGGVAAVIDPVGLAVRRVVRFPAMTGDATAVLSVDGSRLVVGAGHTVRVVPLETTVDAATWSFDTPVRGLTLTKDRLYVGQRDGIVLGSRRTPVPGLVRVVHKS